MENACSALMTIFTTLRFLCQQGLSIQGHEDGQCYDGASAMSGKFKGLQKIVADLQQKAIYVHCAAHSLNLAVPDCLHHLPCMRDIMNLAKDLINTVRESPKRILHMLGRGGEGRGEQPLMANAINNLLGTYTPHHTTPTDCLSSFTRFSLPQLTSHVSKSAFTVFLHDSILFTGLLKNNYTPTAPLDQPQEGGCKDTMLFARLPCIRCKQVHTVRYDLRSVAYSCWHWGGWVMQLACWMRNGCWRSKTAPKGCCARTANAGGPWQAGVAADAESRTG
ncbi:hypothetical protein PR048_028558 [Dryococelus australis]|uniref:DUF4371 domain-containing protein n=1 Tax=Dryococelus australis TaxID=614101 RepID=A0ABQ9GBL0_9NEOP|nr:hypothetical protein PR048_028558 [Dryococelus australis]